MINVSWSEFLYTAIILVGMYYAIATLLLYSHEIIAFTKSGFRKPSSGDSSPAPETTTVMGEVRTNDMDLIEERASELRGEGAFADSDIADTLLPAGKSKHDVLSDLANELTKEVNVVVQLAIDLSSDENETASLFNALLIRFPEVAASSLRASFNQTIAEAVNVRLKLPVSVDQVNQWWNE